MSKQARKTQISQLFTLRTAMAKSRYKTHVRILTGILRGAQAFAFARSSFAPDRIPDSPFQSGIPSNGHGHNGHSPFVRLSDGRAENTRTKSSNEWLSVEYFQHAPNSTVRVGGTSKSKEYSTRNTHMSCTHVHTHVARGQAHQMVDWCVWCEGSGLGGLGAGGAPVFLWELAAHLLALLQRSSFRKQVVGSISASEEHSLTG